MAERELTDAEIRQIDHVHETAYNTICELLGTNELLWNMEWIGELADCMVGIACEHFGLLEEDLYPYLEQ